MNAETQLREDVRLFTGEAGIGVDNSGLESAISRAKMHIRSERGLEKGFEWFDPENPVREQALFWYSCLFIKLQVGELDSQTISVGSIDANDLLAKDNNTETVWFRNARRAIRAINAETSSYGTYNNARGNRQYEGGSSSGIETGTETEVDGL